MLVLVTYDVSTQDPEGVRRLRLVARICMNYGLRVQNSVFECDVEPAQFEFMKNELLEIINQEEDSLRFYLLGKNWERRVEHFGIRPSYRPKESFIL